MPSLRDLQCAFARGVFDGDETGVLPFLVERGVDAGGRLRIYRNNAREGFHGQLAATYPVLRRLVGSTYFAQMAWAYQRRHASSCGNLYYAGSRLAKFLEAELGGGAYDYLADVARLEWACHEVQAEADSTPLDQHRLARVPADQHALLRFELAPAVRLLRSVYPVMRIWQTNQAEVAEPETVNLRSRADRLLVRRAGEGIELRQLSGGAYALLAAIDAGFPLDSVLQAAVQVDPQIAVGEELQRWAALGVIVNFKF